MSYVDRYFEIIFVSIEEENIKRYGVQRKNRLNRRMSNGIYGGVREAKLNKSQPLLDYKELQYSTLFL